MSLSHKTLFTVFVDIKSHLNLFLTMKKPGFFAASMAAASATTAITASNRENQSTHKDHGSSSKRNEDSSSEKTSCCSEKFAPRFDGLRFIETLVTAHR
ncbi:hypothetical protein L2E82_42475 [Cichorium intybus]|uniref:Uncharacterized protein n=1 Tax=Cichorium intybus TaxID=13427 RepID=A0ACB8ZMJ5_CICIN|nr:hypothetical protein L2E82_42475 [Cichorium intybus]